MENYEKILIEEIIKRLTTPDDWVLSDDSQLTYIYSNISAEFFMDRIKIFSGICVVIDKDHELFEVFLNAGRAAFNYFKNKKCSVLLHKLDKAYHYKYCHYLSVQLIINQHN